MAMLTVTARDLVESLAEDLDRGLVGRWLRVAGGLAQKWLEDGNTLADGLAATADAIEGDGADIPEREFMLPPLALVLTAAGAMAIERTRMDHGRGAARMDVVVGVVTALLRFYHATGWNEPVAPLTIALNAASTFYGMAEKLARKPDSDKTGAGDSDDDAAVNVADAPASPRAMSLPETMSARELLERIRGGAPNVLLDNMVHAAFARLRRAKAIISPQLTNHLAAIHEVAFGSGDASATVDPKACLAAILGAAAAEVSAAPMRGMDPMEYANANFIGPATAILVAAGLDEQVSSQVAGLMVSAATCGMALLATEPGLARRLQDRMGK